MSKKSKFFLCVVLAAFLYLIVWAVTSVPKPPPPAEPDNSPRLMSYDDNVLNEFRDGKLLWELKAKKITINIDSKDSDMEDISGKFYGDDGRVVELTAQKGIYNENTQNVTLTGNIKATVSDGAEVTGDKLMWDSAKQMLIVEGNFKGKKDDIRLSGDRAETTDGFKNFKIIGHAHVEKGVRDDTQN